MLPASYRWPAPEVLSRLVHNAQAGEGGAVDVLLAAIRPALLTFFRQRTDGDGAEDLTQLTLVRITGAIGHIDPQRADSYLSAVARNLLRTTYRVAARDRRRTTTLDEESEIADEYPSDTRAEYRDLAVAIHRACLAMEHPSLRDVALGVLRGDSAAEIAEQLDISPITVRTRLMRVRAILRRELPAYLSEHSSTQHQA